MKHTTLGAAIRTLRKQNKMTQAQLADKIGVTDKAVSKWERDLSYPDIALFPKLADLLGVTTDDLLNECIEEGQPSRLLQIYELSHDIRTPLHIILGCVNMARLHHEDTDLLLRYLESIRISGEYLLRQVDRVMDFTQKKQQGGQEEHKDGAGKGAENGEAPAFPANLQELETYLAKRTEEGGEELEKYDFSGRRFLIAEDMELNREIAAEILRQTGVEVAFARNGRICLEMIEEAPAGYYDLILMDIMMPDMDGMEATRRIRALEDPAKAAIPIIAVSANVYERDRAEALQAGMNDFAEKPISIEGLFAAIRKQLA